MKTTTTAAKTDRINTICATIRASEAWLIEASVQGREDSFVITERRALDAFCKELEELTA